MAKVRIAGFSTQFELENELVGIGTDNPTNTLQALGNIRSSDAKAIGVSTFTTYQGFTDTKLSLEGSAGAKQHTTSGEIIIEGEVTVSSGTTFTSGPENLTVTDSFTLPGISEDKPTAGTTRFNENLGSLEFYTGSEWRAVNSYVDMGNRGRVVFGGTQIEASDEVSTNIYSIQISTQGNAVNFGDTTQARSLAGGCASATRGLFGGGFSAPTRRDTIDYVTIASYGNAIDFGNLITTTAVPGAVSSSTRGIFAGGSTPSFSNVIEYVEIPTLGNGSDFGDLIEATSALGALGSPTVGVFGGGYAASGETGVRKRIQSITIASKGNAISFGDLSAGRKEIAAASNSVRGIFAGGGTPQGTSPTTDSGKLKVIDYITIASAGNAVDFGNLIEGRMSHTAAAGQIRAVFAGGDNQTISPKPYRNSIEYVNIATTGNAMDFGDLPLACKSLAPASDSHGGLGGF